MVQRRTRSGNMPLMRVNSPNQNGNTMVALLRARPRRDNLRRFLRRHFERLRTPDSRRIIGV